MAAILLHAALGLALLTGFGVIRPAAVADALKVLDLMPPRVPPPPPPFNPQPRRERKSSAAAPPNLKAQATEIVAPRPVIPPLLPPPLPAAPIADRGVQPSSGASDRAGPGTGAGGEGIGTGSGGNGDGDGGDDTPPQRRSGRITDRDYPRAAGEQGASGTVGVRYTVSEQGRVTDCFVTHSSGNAELDTTTCRLIRERFRFEPSRDARGRPVESMIVENHSWGVRRDVGE